MKRRDTKAPHAPRWSRAGSTLVELLAALPVALLLATTAALLLVHVARTARAQSSALTTTRELRQAVRVLSAELEPLDGSALRIVSDTLLQFSSQLGVMIGCASPSGRTVVAAVPLAINDQWMATLKAGDELRVWHLAPLGLPPVARRRVLAAPPTALGSGACGADNATSSGSRWRLTLTDSSHGLAVGTPVSLHREVRYRHYRSGSTWWLGRQAWDGTGWETVQPVAGPLRAPASGVVTVRARDQHDQPLAIGLATPDSTRARTAWLSVTLGMARRTTQRGLRADDSVAVRIPLRADAYRRR